MVIFPRNTEYKYEGREKLPMKKIEQGKRPHRRHNKRRSRERDLHMNDGYVDQNEGFHGNTKAHDTHQHQSRSQHGHQGGFSHHRDQRHWSHYQGNQHNWNGGGYQYQECNWRHDGHRHWEDREYNGGRDSYSQNNGYYPPHHNHFFRQGYRDGYNDERSYYYPRRGRNHRHYQGGGSDRNQGGGRHQWGSDRNHWGGRHQHQPWDDRSHHWKSENWSQKRNRHDSGEMNKSGSQNYKRQNSLSKKNKNSPNQRHKDPINNPCSSTLENEKTSKSTCAEDIEGRSVCPPSSSSTNNVNREIPSDLVTDTELIRIAETELVISQEHQPPVESQTNCINSKENGGECTTLSCHRKERVQNSDHNMDDGVESVPCEY